MRTMLKLILLCSLAQFSLQSAPFVPEDCGTIYQCYAPISCNDPNGFVISTSNVIKVDNFFKIHDSCPALIKLYAYQKYLVDVVIESIDATAKSIEFVHYAPGDVVKTVFSCKENAGKFEGIYTNNVLNKNVKKTVQKTARLVCNFEVKLGTSDTVLDVSTNEGVTFKIMDKNDNFAETSNVNYALGLTEHCDPFNLDFDKNDQPDTKLVYMKVQYKHNEIYCEHKEISTLQYLDATNALKSAKDGKKLICKANSKVYHDETISIPEYTNARCKADAKYFCSYEPQEPATLDASQKKLDFHPPDKEAKVAGSLKCDATHPHLFIKGKPVFKEGTRTAPEIECNNYGGTPTWTVNGIRLAKNGPVAHCSNKLVCKDLYKIQQSSVLRGRLNTYDYPECFATGTLREHSGTKLPASNFRCDESTGEYKYDAGGMAKNVEGVKFECIYPPPVDIIAKNKKNTQTLAIGVTASGIGVGIITAALFGGFLWFARWSYRRERKRQQAAEKAAYELFTMNKKQREKIKEDRMKKREEAKKNAKATPSSSSEANDDRKMKEFNNKIMAGYCRSFDFARVAPKVVAPQTSPTNEEPNGLTAAGKPKKDKFTVGAPEFIGRVEKKYLKAKAAGYETKEKK